MASPYDEELSAIDRRLNKAGCTTKEADIARLIELRRLQAAWVAAGRAAARSAGQGEGRERYFGHLGGKGFGFND